MKPIASPEEPKCLLAWRSCNPDATWDEFRNANRDPPDGGKGCAREVLEALIDAQHGLCAFCEIQLDPPLWAQVEHWHPKDPRIDPSHNWGLDFTNFMAGCEGGERDKPDRGRSLPPISETRHCGPAKDNRVLVQVLLDPRRDVPRGRPLWKFEPTGEMSVVPSPVEPELVARGERTIKLLNLNSRVLKRLRKVVWQELNADILSAWETLGATEETYPKAYEYVAGERLASKTGRLDAFWSVIRSFLNEMNWAAEHWLAHHPEVFERPPPDSGPPA